MFLRNHKTKIYLVVILIISTLFTSCRALFPTQRMLDDVLPYRDTHYYCKSDVVPFSREELKNAKTIYGVELSEYFYEFKDMNLPEKEKEEFLRTLTYRNANYTLIKDRYEMYNDDQARDIHDYNQADKEFNAFYKLEDSPLADIIKENNNGQLAGNPNISFKLYLNTCHKVDDIYFEGDAEIYVPVAIPNKEYEKIPIGKPFPNERVILLDENEKEIKEQNKVGEICVIGTCLGLGYYNNIEQTNKVFTKNPNQKYYLESMYHTGDLAYYDSNNDLVFNGRRDFQIKYQGHRIELEEIDKAINSCDNIVRSCTIFDENKSKLYGFYIGNIANSDLKKQLREVLPVYMIPTSLIKVDEFPLTKNGKIDRKRLLELKEGKKCLTKI